LDPNKLLPDLAKLKMAFLAVRSTPRTSTTSLLCPVTPLIYHFRRKLLKLPSYLLQLKVNIREFGRAHSSKQAGPLSSYAATHLLLPRRLLLENTSTKLQVAESTRFSLPNSIIFKV
jgi:hypothetical protein